MGTWNTSANGTVVVLAGDGVRTAYVAPNRHPSSFAHTFEVADYTHEVMALLFSDPLGSCAWEIGVDNTATAIVRRVDWGTPQSPVASAPSGLSPGIPASYEIRLRNGTVSLHLNGSATPVVSYTFSPSDPWINQGFYGFAATANGARVTNPQIGELQPVQVSRADVLAVIAGTSLYASTGRNAGITLVASNVVAASGRVSIANFHQAGWIADGTGRIFRFDPVSMSVQQQTPTAGVFPKANLIVGHVDRLWMNDVDNPQNIIASRIGQPLDVDTGKFEAGAAFALNAANIGQIGQPVRCMIPGRGPIMYVGCTASWWQMEGIPPLGFQVSQLTNDAGSSGPRAAWLTEEGVMVHGTEGAALLNPGRYKALSYAVLTELLQVDDPEAYDVQVVRDPGRHGVHFFLTPVAGGPGVHFWYDERVGDYDPRRGGWFPEEWPAAFGPRSSTYWGGVVVLGGDDGYLRYFDSSVKGDDDGTPISSRMPLRLTDDPDPAYDTDLMELRLKRSLDSDPVTFRVYGGLTAEMAYGEGPLGAARWQTAAAVVSQIDHPMTDMGRAPHLVGEISNNVRGRSWAYESLLIVAGVAELTSRIRRIGDAPPAPCTIPAGAGSGGASASFSGLGSWGSGPGPGSGGSGIGGVVVTKR